MVAIARAIDISADVLILDEPTSSLDTGEVERLFDLIRQLTSRGIAVVFVSHFLDQVFEIADRITVLRNGKLVGEWPKAELTRVKLVSEMLGREVKTLEALERKTREPGDSLETATPVLERHGGRPKEGDRAVRPRSLPRRGRRAGRTARLGTYGARAPALRRRPLRLRAQSSSRGSGSRSGIRGSRLRKVSRSAPRTVGRRGSSRSSPSGRTSSSLSRLLGAGRGPFPASARRSSPSTGSARSTSGSRAPSSRCAP